MMQRISGQGSSSTDGCGGKVPEADLNPRGATLWKNTISVLDSRLSRGCGDLRSGESAFDTGQGGGGFLGSVAVVQHRPSTFLLAQNLHYRGFPMKCLGVLITPV